MPKTPSPAASAIPRAAVVGAFLFIAQTVASKSTRDALFCAQFPTATLPKAMVAGALLSAFFALVSGRAYRSFGPNTVLPLLLLANSGGFVAEYVALPLAPRGVTLLLYLHISALTGLFVSGFWSVVNERFDPHTLRASISRIGIGATIGGIAGGLGAERIAALSDTRHTLLLLGFLSAASALSLRFLVEPQSVPTPSLAPRIDELKSNYLRELALFVAVTALASSVIDFAFKARAMEYYASAEQLARFFAVFYTAASVLSFLFQSFLTPRLLDRAGLGTGLAGLPAAVVAFGLLALVIPGLITQALLRGLDNALSSSLFRSAYEPLFTPLAAERKRSVKAMIDVLVNRLGDGAGSLLSWGLVLLLPRAAASAATGSAVVLSLMALWLAERLRRGYIDELAASLRSGAVVLNENGVNDLTTRLTLSRTIGEISRERLQAEIQRLRERELAGDGPLRPEPKLTPEQRKRQEEALAGLLSGEAARIRSALEGADAAFTAFLIPLVGRDDVGGQVMGALGGFGARVTGQLADALLDHERFSRTVRRRLVRVISSAKTPWAAAALVAALDDPEFEVRREVVRGLDVLAEHDVAIPLLRPAALGAARRDLADATGAPLHERIEQALRLLGLAFDHEAFRLCRAALSSNDSKLRGTALEYLENILPEAERAQLFAALAAEATPKPRREEREIIEELRRTLA
jgi:AAA family ATP:ADP antiporter